MKADINEIRTQIIMDTVGIEGGYSNHEDDSGGKTRYGITEFVAERHGYDVSHLTVGQAVDIYQRCYWDKLSLDNIALQSEIITQELFDTGVNMGVSRSAEFLQRALNVLNQKSRLFADLKVDGAIGPMTHNALRIYLNKRGTKGELVLLNMLNALQGAFYVELAERREKDESFIYGWFKNRINLS